MPKITKRVVDAIQPDPEGERFTWDSELKGFGVRMMPSGVASFILKYRNAENRQRKLALGRVGTLTPDQARDIARQRLAAIARGEDPSAERKQVRKSATVSEVCDLYLVEAKGHLKPRSLDLDRSRIACHIKPLLGRQAMAGLTTADVSRMQTDIAAGRTATTREEGRGSGVRGGKTVAAGAVVLMGTIFEFAIRQGIVTDNVARAVKRPAPVKRQRYLSFAEMKRFGAALRKCEGENATALAAIRFLLLSGCRKNEVLALPAEWVDRDAGCIRFGDTKTGAQLRPIGAAAFEVLPQATEGWVFPAARGSGHFVGVRKVLDRVCAEAKLEGISVHVLRHSFASAAAAIGYSELTIAGLLGHTVQGVTARYAHVPDAALVAAADAVSAKIAEALD